MVDRDVLRLSESLFRIALAERSQPLSAELRRTACEANDAQWDAARVELIPHKIFPLLTHQLEYFGLLERVPSQTRQKLVQIQKDVRSLNAAMVLMAMTSLRALERAGEQPLLIKGIVFANDLYPDVSARPMGDIDVVSAPTRHAALLEGLAKVGFRPAKNGREEHAVILEHQSGVRCDAHETLSIFADEAWETLTRETTLSRLHGIRVRVLEPSAMLAHLAAHMGGHSKDLGPVLLWIADAAFVLRRHGHEIDPHRAARLCVDDGHWTFFLRVLGFLSALGETLPPQLEAWAKEVPALSFAEVLRLRRTVPWGLPRARGFARVFAQSLTIKDYKERPALLPTDVMFASLDALTQHVAERRLKRHV